MPPPFARASRYLLKWSFQRWHSLACELNGFEAMQSLSKPGWTGLGENLLYWQFAPNLAMRSLSAIGRSSAAALSVRAAVRARAVAAG